MRENQAQNPFSVLLERVRGVKTGLMLVVVFTSGFLLGNLIDISASNQIPLSAEEEQEFAAFWQAYELLRSDFIDPLDPHLVVEGAITGMLDSVGDQYTGYMNSEVFSMMNEDISGEIQGIGVVIRTQEETGYIEVANVLKDTPAERAGVRVGDIFKVVDGEDVLGFSQFDLAGVVRGPRGTFVDITFIRDEDDIDMSIERDTIPIPTIEYLRLEDNIGYVRMFEFNAQSRPQMEEAIEAMGGTAELDALILDLRGNPGGTLSSSIDISSAFLEDAIVLREEFAGGREDTLRTNNSYNGFDLPLVILVDETSASASELVSGAMQDNDRAIIVGEVTFGKGTVQTWQPLSNGGGVRVTIARWLTPDGNWIHEEGITPDILIEWEEFATVALNLDDPESIENDPQLQAAIDYLLNGTASLLQPETDNEAAEPLNTQ